MNDPYKLKVDPTLAEVESCNGVWLLEEGECPLGVWAERVAREVQVDQRILHCSVLLHAVCQVGPTCGKGWREGGDESSCK